MLQNFLEKIFNPGARGKIWRLLILIIVLVIFGTMIDGGNYYNKGSEWISVKTGHAINLPKVKEVPFKLGLDLLGGTHLVYQADMANIASKDQTSAIEGVRDVIERRVNTFGVSEPLVQTSISGSDYRIIVELAGVKEIDEAIKMIGETPLLEFKEQADKNRTLTDEEKKQIADANKNAENKATDVLGKLLSGGDFTALAKQYSEEQGAKDNGGDLGWITESARPGETATVKNFKIGEISHDLVEDNTSYQIYKLVDKRIKTNPFNNKEPEKEVKAAHILICFKGIENCSNNFTKEEALAKIKELKSKANPKNFAQLAKENSTEPGANTTGGELGWFDRAAMVKPFADAVFAQKVGTISDAVETQFGYHLIYKQEERPITEYKVSRIVFGKMSESSIIGPGKEWENTELTGKNLKRANVVFNPNDNSPEVSLEFDNEGAKMFEEITGRNVTKPVAIFLDGYIISSPTVNEKITGGKAVISGKFSITEAKTLSQRLNAGALPVPIKLINQANVGASLGQASLDMSLKAGLLGFLLVALFMILYYRLPGIISIVALAFYGILTLAMFKIFSITLSLAGMAGFILSVGMAVDANVLIFERLKEELRAKKPLGQAISEAFTRAWPSIRDGNYSTLITCVILMWFSTSVVKGFAITLSLGILISMFTAITVTRTLLLLIVGKWTENRLWLLSKK